MPDADLDLEPSGDGTASGAGAPGSDSSGMPAPVASLTAAAGGAPAPDASLTAAAGGAPAPDASLTAAAGGAPAPRARSRRGYFLPGAIALAALLLIGAAVGAGDLSHPSPRTLRGADVAAQISLGVQ